MNIKIYGDAFLLDNGKDSSYINLGSAPNCVQTKEALGIHNDACRLDTHHYGSIITSFNQPMLINRDGNVSLITPNKVDISVDKAVMQLPVFRHHEYTAMKTAFADVYLAWRTEDPEAKELLIDFISKHCAPLMKKYDELGFLENLIMVIEDLLYVEEKTAYIFKKKDQLVPRALSIFLNLNSNQMWRIAFYGRDVYLVKSSAPHEYDSSSNRIYNRISGLYHSITSKMVRTYTTSKYSINCYGFTLG